MKYTIEDTPTGYRLTMQGEAGAKRVHDEEGGHGPIEGLYTTASAVWLDVLATERHAEREP